MILRRNVLLLSGCLGCSAARPSAPPPLDDGWQSSPSAPTETVARPGVGPRAIPPDQRRPWSHKPLLPSLGQTGGRTASEHLGGGYERTVRVNERAAGYVRADRGPMPAGALIVQLHHLPGEDGVEAIFVMEKRQRGYAPAERDWSFAVLDPQWRVEAEGPLKLCADCHRGAPRDFLFGLPRAPAAQAEPAER